MIDIFLELRYTLCDAFQLIHRIKIARNDERVLPSSSFSENPNAFEKGGGSEEEGRGLENQDSRFYFQTPPSPDRTGAARSLFSSSAFVWSLAFGTNQETNKTDSNKFNLTIKETI